jgi:hypothetical protein
MKNNEIDLAIQEFNKMKNNTQTEYKKGSGRLPPPLGR